MMSTMSRPPLTVPRAELEEIVKNSASIGDVWRSLGFTCSCGGVAGQVIQAIQTNRLGAATSHWITPIPDL